MVCTLPSNVEVRFRMVRGVFKIMSKFYAGRIFDIVRSVFLHGIMTRWPMGIAIEISLAGSMTFPLNCTDMRQHPLKNNALFSNKIIDHFIML